MIEIGRIPTEQDKLKLSSVSKRLNHNDLFGRTIIKEMFKNSKNYSIIDNDTPTIWNNNQIPLKFSIDLKLINKLTNEINYIDVEYCDITSHSPKLKQFLVVHNRKPNNQGYCKHKEWNLPNRKGMFMIYPNSNQCYFIQSSLLLPLINQNLDKIILNFNQLKDFSLLYNKTVIRNNSLNFDKIKII